MRRALREQRVGEDLAAVAGLQVGFHSAIVSGTMDDINTLRRILHESRTLAVVGLSADWFRPSYFAAKYMQEHGYRVIPVNPKYESILGEKCYKSLRDIPERSTWSTSSERRNDVMPIAEEAIAIGAKVLWQQLGVKNEAAAAKARAGGPGGGHGPVRQDRARPAVRRPQLGRRKYPRNLGKAPSLARLLTGR